MRRNFFSRLLALNRRLFEELRTPAGRPLGDFYLLAEQPNNARRHYEKQIRQVGDGWELRLLLGNCDFRLGHARVARSNYHWAFVLGLPEHSWNLIEDTGFLARLRDAEDPEWAFPEVCAAGELPPPRFSSSDQFKAFKSGFVPAPGELCGPRRFCLHWIISENKAFCSDNELIDTRMEMKALNPRCTHGTCSVLHERLDRRDIRHHERRPHRLYIFLLRPLVRTMRVHITVLSVCGAGSARDVRGRSRRD